MWKMMPLMVPGVVPPPEEPAMFQAKLWNPVQPCVSVASTVKVNDPVFVGVPVIAPALENDRPGGNVPPETRNV